MRTLVVAHGAHGYLDALDGGQVVDARVDARLERFALGVRAARDEHARGARAAGVVGAAHHAAAALVAIEQQQGEGVLAWRRLKHAAEVAAAIRPHGPGLREVVSARAAGGGSAPGRRLWGGASGGGGGRSTDCSGDGGPVFARRARPRASLAAEAGRDGGGGASIALQKTLVARGAMRDTLTSQASPSATPGTSPRTRQSAQLQHQSRAFALVTARERRARRAAHRTLARRAPERASRRVRLGISTAHARIGTASNQTHLPPETISGLS